MDNIQPFPLQVQCDLAGYRVHGQNHRAKDAGDAGRIHTKHLVCHTAATQGHGDAATGNGFEAIKAREMRGKRGFLPHYKGRELHKQLCGFTEMGDCDGGIAPAMIMVAVVALPVIHFDTAKITHLIINGTIRRMILCSSMARFIVVAVAAVVIVATCQKQQGEQCTWYNHFFHWITPSVISPSSIRIRRASSASCRAVISASRALR